MCLTFPVQERVHCTIDSTVLDKLFADFSGFGTVSLQHKWNRTTSLSPDSKCTNCQTTKDFHDYKIWGNSKKIPDMLGFDNKYPASLPKDKLWHLCSTIFTPRL